MLRNFEKRFSNLNLKTKTQIYLLPLLLLFIVYYNFELIYQHKTNEVKIDKKENLDIKFKGDYLEMFSLIEKISIVNKSKILHIKKDKNKIFLVQKSTFKAYLDFLDALENINNFTSVNSLKVYTDEKSFIFETLISFDKFYKKNLKKIEFNKAHKEEFKLFAIIDKHILLNNQILKIGDSYKDYKLIEVYSNHIILHKDGNIIKVEIENEKFTKYFD